MLTVEKIVDAARRLDCDQLNELRRRLRKLEQEMWEAERQRVAKELAAKGVTDAVIDDIIMRRRRQSRQRLKSSRSPPAQ